MQGAKLCKLQNHARCKIMQGAKLCKVHNYARCKIMQGAKLCKVQNHAKCKITQGAKLCKGQHFVRCKNMQGVKLCKVQDYTRCKAVPGLKPMFCNSLGAEGAKVVTLKAWAPKARMLMHTCMYVWLCVRPTILILFKVYVYLFLRFFNSKFSKVLKQIIYSWIKWIMERCYLHLWWYFLVQSGIDRNNPEFFASAVHSRETTAHWLKSGGSRWKEKTAASLWDFSKKYVGSEAISK